MGRPSRWIMGLRLLTGIRLAGFVRFSFPFLSSVLTPTPHPGVSDPANPFNNNAQPNSWTPPLNTSWTWGKDRVFGVNLGGWLVMEPFITPSYYQKYTGAVDEFTLSTLMSADTAGGGLAQLETHYDTFIVSSFCFSLSLCLSCCSSSFLFPIFCLCERVLTSSFPSRWIDRAGHCGNRRSVVSAPFFPLYGYSPGHPYTQVPV